MKKIHLDKNRKIIAGIVACVLLIAAIIAMILSHSATMSKEYDDMLLAGDKYIQQFDYEKAEDSYLKAIDIDKKRVDSYRKLTDLYMRTREYKKAEDMLQTAKNNVAKDNAEEIGQKQTFVDYVQNTVLSEYTEIENGEYNGNFDKQEFLNAVIKDMDNDGHDELVVIALNNKDNKHQFEVIIYELNQNQVTQQDIYNIDHDLMNTADGKYVFFVQESEEGIYICGTIINQDNHQESFILNYDGKIKEYANSQNEEEFKIKLGEIGLNAEDIYFSQIDYDKYMMIEIQTRLVDNKIIIDMIVQRQKTDKEGKELYKDIINGYYLYRSYNIIPNSFKTSFKDLSFLDDINMALLDINGDGCEELIVETDYKISIWAYNGYDISLVVDQKDHVEVYNDNTLRIDNDIYELSSKGICSVVQGQEEVNAVLFKTESIDNFYTKQIGELTGWAKLYKDYIDKLSNAKNLEYYIIDLNNDDIPDLDVVYNDTHIIMTISQGRLVTYKINASSLSYVEGINTIIVEQRASETELKFQMMFGYDAKVDFFDQYHIKVYSLNNGQFKTLNDLIMISGTKYTTSDNSKHFDFVENGKAVTGAKYNQYYEMFVDGKNDSKKTSWNMSDTKQIGNGGRAQLTYDQLLEILSFY